MEITKRYMTRTRPPKLAREATKLAEKSMFLADCVREGVCVCVVKRSKMFWCVCV